MARNRIRCLDCDTIIESRSRHDFVVCPCYTNEADGTGCFVDGGTDYARYGFKSAARVNVVDDDGTETNLLELNQIQMEEEAKRPDPLWEGGYYRSPDGSRVVAVIKKVTTHYYGEVFLAEASTGEIHLMRTDNPDGWSRVDLSDWLHDPELATSIELL